MRSGALPRPSPSALDAAIFARESQRMGETAAAAAAHATSLSAIMSAYEIATTTPAPAPSQVSPPPPASPPPSPPRMRSPLPLSWIHPPPLYHGLCCASLASLHILLCLVSPAPSPALASPWPLGFLLTSPPGSCRYWRGRIAGMHPLAETT